VSDLIYGAHLQWVGPKFFLGGIIEVIHLPYYTTGLSARTAYKTSPFAAHNVSLIDPRVLNWQKLNVVSACETCTKMDDN